MQTKLRRMAAFLCKFWLLGTNSNLENRKHILRAKNWTTISRVRGHQTCCCLLQGLVFNTVSFAFLFTIDTAQKKQKPDYDYLKKLLKGTGDRILNTEGEYWPSHEEVV